METRTGRYALYFAPESTSALWRFGSRTIGYDAVTGEQVPPVAPQGLGWQGLHAMDWADATADPRKYGFHATLKAPFELSSEHSESELIDSLDAFARRATPLLRLDLEVRALGAFIAIVPQAANTALQALAFRVVADFEPFRAPLGEKDRARRLASPLTERQILLLDRYGYPYVDEEFRFHMTLTGKLAADRVEPVRAALAAAFAAEVPDASIALDTIALYHQKDRASPFRIIARFVLAGREIA
jgi:putative phosphonate metabolism protein